MDKTKSISFRDEIMHQRNLEYQSAHWGRWNERQKNLERSRKLNAAMRNQLELYNLSLDKMLEEDKAALNKFISETRLKNEKRVVVKHSKNYISDLLNWPKKSILNVKPSYASILMANLKPLTENDPVYYDGQILLPDSINNIKLIAKDFGSGYFGIEAQASNPDSHKVINLEYTFIPNQTANWNFMTSIEFHGFYIVFADDSWWNSREASVSLETKISVSQYFLGAEKTEKLIDIGDDNIKVSSIYDNMATLLYNFPLRKDDPATVHITISLNAYAKGDDSYAELNFSDGSTNFILPHETVAIVNP
jgi:hypothetical protein